MSTRLNLLLLLPMQVLLFVTPLAAYAQDTDRPVHWPTTTAVQTEAGQIIPAGAFGIVQIDTPRAATLLHLRGVMGRGIATIRSADNQDCLSLPIRFVAGDFGGDSISTHTRKPIRLILQTAAVAKALARGEDVVSDMYRTSSQITDSNADIVIERGLSDGYGFVLNPGASVVADVFGAKASRTTCSKL